MGMDPFNFADSLLAVLAQLLVKKLCPHCRTVRPAREDEEQELLDDWLHAFGTAPQAPVPGAVTHAPSRESLLAQWRAAHGDGQRLNVYAAKGCERCDNSGFKGRIGLHELMVIDRELRYRIQTNSRSEELQRCGLAAGMRTLRQDGIEKVLAGLTTIEEVRATSNV
jgi:type II secretory ATPase GspE/PulE/Tfp pilus assembly ATPase PilB-like protein